MRLNNSFCPFQRNIFELSPHCDVKDLEAKGGHGIPHMNGKGAHGKGGPMHAKDSMAMMHQQQHPMPKMMMPMQMQMYHPPY